MDKEADFDMAIQRHLTRAHKLRAIQHMIAEDPAIVPELLEILTAPPGSVAPPPSQDVRRRFDSETQSEKVVAFFKGRGNASATIREIAEATGLTRNTVNALLYNSTQKKLFKSTKMGPRKTIWRLVEDQFDETYPNTEMTLDELAELGLSESDLDEDGSASPAAKPATGPKPKYEPEAE